MRGSTASRPSISQTRGRRRRQGPVRAAVSGCSGRVVALSAPGSRRRPGRDRHPGRTGPARSRQGAGHGRARGETGVGGPGGGEPPLMDVVAGVEGLRPPNGPIFAVIGVFDGLHRGHAYLLERLVREADRAIGTSVDRDHLRPSSRRGADGIGAAAADASGRTSRAPGRGRRRGHGRAAFRRRRPTDDVRRLHRDHPHRDGARRAA